MDLQSLRKQLRSGELFSGEPTEYQFVPLPREENGAWILDGRSIRHAGNIFSKEIKEGDGALKVRIGVTLDAGRWLGAAYTGPLKQRVVVMGFLGRIVMVWPIWKPGLQDSVGNILKEPTPADERCYEVEVLFDLDPRCVCDPKLPPYPLGRHRISCPVRMTKRG